MLNRFVLLAAAAALACMASMAAVITDEATIEGVYTTVVLSPEEGCVVEEFVFNGSTQNFAGPLGLLQEGFGVGNYYVPNRRLNERLEGFDDNPDQPVLRYSYDCDGPNIRGIHVIRIMEPIPDESAVRVTWRLEHRGNETQWIAPWVRCDWAPGGSADANDRVDIATSAGVRNIVTSQYVQPSRNWAAATDPEKKKTVYGVFDAEQTFSILAEREREERHAATVKTHYVPQRFAPGDTWETTYRVNIVRGLSHIDFASEEMAAQIDYESGTLTVRLAAPAALPEMQLNAVVVDAQGNATELEPKRFSLDPNSVIRCAYEWTAPRPGRYDFLGQITVRNRPFTLGKETRSPHGGIDTQFTVGDVRGGDMASWTDAPHALDRGSRTLTRDMAAPGDVAIWFESPLEKIFREDVPQPTGRIESTGRLSLARNESESIQVIVRPPADAPIAGATIQVSDLEHASGSGSISADNIAVHRVGYVPVRTPSYFEGPTGLFPDPLTPVTRLDAAGGQCTPLWITVTAPEDARAGKYTGLLTLQTGEAPIELWMEAEVFDFTLPRTPALKTDFGFHPSAAIEQHQSKGYRGSPESLLSACANLAFGHRIALREIVSFPGEQADYAAALKRFEPDLAELKQKAGAIAVPQSLLGFPEQLALANEFVREHELSKRVYVPLAQDPPQPAWPQVYDDATAWKKIAPDIPIMISTYGMSPFLTDAADIWSVHVPLLDTTNNRAILEYPSEGGEVWCYVDHAPPRPYPNFFTDFAAIEHRILFWQTRLLGFRGVQYWAVNVPAGDDDPWTGSCDITPVNGDGLLIYPSKDGPVPSIRLAAIRDGVEDYDYLALLSARLEDAKDRGAPQSLLQRGVDAGNLEELVKSLVQFSRDPKVLEARRRIIAEAIVALKR